MNLKTGEDMPKDDIVMKEYLEKVDNNLKNAQYKMACFTCGEEYGLCMFAHRNKASLIVGWLFSCMSCMHIIKDGSIDVKLKAEG